MSNFTVYKKLFSPWEGHGGVDWGNKGMIIIYKRGNILLGNTKME